MIEIEIVNEYQVALFVEAQVVMTEVEGMKADNQACAAMGDGPMWRSYHFNGAAKNLQTIAEHMKYYAGVN